MLKKHSVAVWAALVALPTMADTVVVQQNTTGTSGARLSLGPVAGATSVDVNSDNASTLRGRYNNDEVGYGASALIEFPMSTTYGIETGAMYMRRKFGLGNSDLQVTRTVPTLIVPIEPRIWLGNLFSFTVGGFGAFRVGSVKDSVTVGNTTASRSFDSSRKNAEFGLTGAADVNIAVSRRSGIFVEGRYNYGLTDPSENGLVTERMRDLLVIAGLRMDLTY